MFCASWLVTRSFVADFGGPPLPIRQPLAKGVLTGGGRVVCPWVSFVPSRLRSLSLELTLCLSLQHGACFNVVRARRGTLMLAILLLTHHLLFLRPTATSKTLQDSTLCTSTRSSPSRLPPIPSKSPPTWTPSRPRRAAPLALTARRSPSGFDREMQRGLTRPSLLSEVEVVDPELSKVSAR